MRKHLTTAFTGITAGMVAWFMATTPAVSLPQPTPVSAASVCETGQRGQADYDRLCLHTGTLVKASALWFSTPEGKRGHEKDDMATRRGICKYAYRHGGVRNEAAELVNDMAYDNYRNYKQVNAWTGDVAQGDCLRLGYTDPVSGRAAVNLSTLPKGNCWVEVYYGNATRTRISREVMCAGS